MTQHKLSHKILLPCALAATKLFLAGAAFLAQQDLGRASTWNAPVTPLVHENGRRSHAQELLGKKYQVSWARRAESYSGFMNLALQNEIRNLLPESHKQEAQKLATTIIAESKHYNLDPVFVLAVIKTESRFRPNIVGRHGEIGLMQIKPDTAQWIARKTGMPWYGRQAMFNVNDNVRYGMAYLNYLRQSFTNRPHRYLNAYNLGSGKIRRMIASEVSPKIYSDKILAAYESLYVRMLLGKSHILVSME